MKKKFFLICISIIFSLIIVELFFILFLPQNLTTGFTTYDKNGLLLNIKNSKANHYFNGKKIAEYKFGKFHNRIYNLPDKERKILVLGDSFTFGWLINDEDTFVYKLNKRFNDFQFINPSVGGWGASDQLEYFINHCNLIKPDHTIIFINLFDISRSIDRSSLFFIDKNNQLKEGKNTINKLRIFFKNLPFYQFLSENYHTLNFLKIVFVKFYYYFDEDGEIYTKLNKNENFEYGSEVYNLGKKIYLKFQDNANQCKTNLIFVNLGWFDYNINQSLTSIFLKQNIFFEKNNLTFIDLNNDLQEVHENYDKFSILGEGHPNILGHEYLFKSVAKKINLLIK